MSAKIERIVERRWTYPGDRKTSWSYNVYYTSGKRVQYSHNKNLPNNILHYILEVRHDTLPAHGTFKEITPDFYEKW